MQDLFTDPQLEHRKTWRKQQHPEMGNRSYRFGSFELSATPGEITAPAPCLGEHNALVFKEWLGYSESEYQNLVEQGVID